MIDLDICHEKAHSSILHHRGTRHAQTHMLSNIRGMTTRTADQQEHALIISTAQTADQQKHAAQQPVVRCRHVSLATIDFHTLTVVS